VPVLGDIELVVVTVSQIERDRRLVSVVQVVVRRQVEGEAEARGDWRPPRDQDRTDRDTKKPLRPHAQDSARPMPGMKAPGASVPAAGHSGRSSPSTRHREQSGVGGRFSSLYLFRAEGDFFLSGHRGSPAPPAKMAVISRAAGGRAWCGCRSIQGWRGSCIDRRANRTVPPEAARKATEGRRQQIGVRKTERRAEPATQSPTRL
jgi:hypothetical protein